MKHLLVQRLDDPEDQRTTDNERHTHDHGYGERVKYAAKEDWRVLKKYEALLK